MDEAAEGGDGEVEVGGWAGDEAELALADPLPLIVT